MRAISCHIIQDIFYLMCKRSFAHIESYLSRSLIRVMHNRLFFSFFFPSFFDNRTKFAAYNRELILTELLVDSQKTDTYKIERVSHALSLSSYVREVDDIVIPYVQIRVKFSSDKVSTIYIMYV